MHGIGHPLRLLATTLAFAVTIPGARAQCQAQWQPGEPAPGPKASSHPGATVWWDPDGSGPAPAVLVVAGQFELPSAGASNLAMLDPATGRWSAFSDSPNGTATALAVLPNGHLAVGGAFSAIGALPAGNLAIWDGTAWSVPGGGVSGHWTANAPVQALEAVPNGDLIVGGAFTAAGSLQVQGLARWDGSQWHALGAFHGEVMRMAQRPNGNVVVAGSFPTPGTSTNGNIAEWNGSGWITYGTGINLPGVRVTALAVATNGDVVIAGLINNAGGIAIDNIARWDGTAWSNIGYAPTGWPDCLLPLPNGYLLAATVMVVNHGFLNGVALFDGQQWRPYAPHSGQLASMAMLPNGQLLGIGPFSGLPSDPIRGVARWDGTAWHQLSNGFDDTVRALVPLPDGDLIATGDFVLAGGTAAFGNARWNGTSWRPLSTPGAPLPLRVSCGTVDATGMLWLGGTGNPQGVVRWNGTSWQQIGGQMNSVTALAIPASQRPFASSAVYPGYGESIAQWNGTQWVRLGAGLDGPVYSLLLRRSGVLVAGGNFVNSGPTPVSRIAWWDGSSWHPFASGLDGIVRALVELPDGDLVAGGEFIMDGIGLRSLDLVARWDGANWQPFGTGLAGDPGTSVHTLLVLPDGDLLAGGDFRSAGGNPAHGIARWNGSRWTPVDGSVDGSVLALAQLADGDVVAAGNFSRAGGVDAAHLAHLRSNCPATVSAYGTACASSAGWLDLVHAGLPWIGAEYRSTCYGVAANGIGMEVLGLQPLQLPLATLHPAAAAGCQLLAQPDAWLLRLPSQGAIVCSFRLPRDPALVGIALHEQVLFGEMGAGGVLSRLAGSNGLALMVGAF